MDDPTKAVDDPIADAMETSGPPTPEYIAAYPAAHAAMIRASVDDLFDEAISDALSVAESRADVARLAMWRALDAADAMRQMHDLTQVVAPGTHSWAVVLTMAAGLDLAVQPADAMAWTRLAEGALEREIAALDRHVADLEAAVIAAEADAAALDQAAADPVANRLARLIDDAELAGRAQARRLPGFQDLSEDERSALSVRMAQAAVDAALDLVEPWPERALIAAKEILVDTAARDPILARAEQEGTGAMDLTRIAAACAQEVARVEGEIRRLTDEEADDAEAQRREADSLSLLEPRIDAAIEHLEMRLARGDVHLRAAGIPIVTGPWALDHADRIGGEVFSASPILIPTVDDLLSTGVVQRRFVPSAAASGTSSDGSAPASGPVASDAGSSRPSHATTTAPTPTGAIPAWDAPARTTLMGIQNEVRSALNLPAYRRAQKDEYRAP